MCSEFRKMILLIQIQCCLPSCFLSFSTEACNQRVYPYSSKKINSSPRADRNYTAQRTSLPTVEVCWVSSWVSRCWASLNLFTFVRCVCAAIYGRAKDASRRIASHHQKQIQYRAFKSISPMRRKITEFIKYLCCWCCCCCFFAFNSES